MPELNQMGFPLDARQTGQLERLLDQQMWALGKDATAPQGNLLARYGFERQPPARPEVSGSYHLSWEGGQLVLSSLGVWVGDGSAHLFLDRGPPFQPKLGGPMFGSNAPPKGDGWSHRARLLACLLRWVINYEQWVKADQGPDWRPATLFARSRRPRLTAEELPLLASSLAEVLVAR